MRDYPKISVILIGWVRLQYIRDAFNSIINQTLPRELYEIIVIKNFVDTKIDSIFIEGNAKVIFSEDQTYGGKVAKAVSVASGEIVCILEDDDIFEPNRLEVIRNSFMECSKPCFYWNQRLIIDESGTVLKEFALKGLKGKVSASPLVLPPSQVGNFRNTSVFNGSSMAMSRSILENHLDHLKVPWNGEDVLFVCAAIADKATLVIDPRRLTRYRIHGLNYSGWIGEKKFNPLVSNGVTFIEKRIAILEYCLPLIEGTALHREFVKSIKRLTLTDHIYFAEKREIRILAKRIASYLLSRSPKDLIDIVVVSCLSLIFLLSTKYPMRTASSLTRI